VNSGDTQEIKGQQNIKFRHPIITFMNIGASMENLVIKTTYAIDNNVHLYTNMSTGHTTIDSSINCEVIFGCVQSQTLTDNADYLTCITEQLLNANNRHQERYAYQSMWKIKNYIEQHLDEDLSLSYLARREFFNPSYLSRVFKQEIGFNMTEYILRQRIKQAESDLTYTDKQIQVIGFELGFNSAQYFNRLFKKMVGMTPGIYREMTANNT
jgi:YesN/AraC family two-component response regulator